IPVLSLFLLSVALGLRLHDLLLGPHPGSALASLQDRWKELSPSTRRQLTTALIAWGVSLLLLFGGTELIHQWIEGTVRAAAGNDSAWLTKMIPRLQRVAPESYIERFFVLFLR